MSKENESIESIWMVLKMSLPLVLKAGSYRGKTPLLVPGVGITFVRK